MTSICLHVSLHSDLADSMRCARFDVEDLVFAVDAVQLRPQHEVGRHLNPHSHTSVPPQLSTTRPQLSTARPNSVPPGPNSVPHVPA
eukprot:1996813-Rhodomonas_salina.2